jgi:hypothetical protein
VHVAIAVDDPDKLVRAILRLHRAYEALRRIKEREQRVVATFAAGFRKPGEPRKDE